MFTYYKPRGWWPLRSKAGTPGFDSRGYHKGDYSLPRTREELFEVVVGAVLTQNTSWMNVEKALGQLQQEGMLSAFKLARADPGNLGRLIRSSGYYNQKTRKLKLIAQYFLENQFFINNPPVRDELLSLWGIGPETADSILLYAFGEPVFVVDAYTKRLLTRLNRVSENASYSEIQLFFNAGTKPAQITSRVHYYNEFHALIVEHAKQHCKKTPVCMGCPVIKYCYFNHNE